MVKITHQFKVGDKVRIINAMAIGGGKKYWKDRDISEVVNVSPAGTIEVAATLPKSSGRSYNELPVFRSEFHALELVATKPTKKQRIEILEKEVARHDSEIEALKEAVEALKKERATRTAVDGIARLLAGEIVEVDGQPFFVKTSVTPNQRRAQIIADAKKFVEETVAFVASANMEEDRLPSLVAHHGHIRVEFVVNAEKRTVVALAYYKHVSAKSFEKAIAKCAPDDVFNADIGKAIAVGRLFGLDVDRFINAPKPDKLVVGTYTSGGGYFTRRKTVRVENGRAYDECNSFWLEEIARSQHLTDIDDTEAQYE